MQFKPDKCPECGGPPAGIVEVVQGLAGLQPDGKGGYDYAGGTDVWWDSQFRDVAPDGTVRLQCAEGHEWYAEQDEQGEPAPVPPRVVVFVEGGSVQTILADRPMEYIVVDYDLAETGDRPTVTVRDTEGALVGEAVVFEAEVTIDTRGNVSHYFDYVQPELCECGRKPQECATHDDPEGPHGDRKLRMPNWEQYSRKLIRADGTVQDYPPKGSTYSLQEMQTAVGGYIEIIRLGEDHLMVLNEEGKLNGLPHNDLATRLCRPGQETFDGDWIAGDVVVCRDGDVE